MASKLNKLRKCTNPNSNYIMSGRYRSGQYISKHQKKKLRTNQHSELHSNQWVIGRDPDSEFIYYGANKSERAINKYESIKKTKKIGLLERYHNGL